MRKVLFLHGVIVQPDEHTNIEVLKVVEGNAYYEVVVVIMVGKRLYLLSE